MDRITESILNEFSADQNITKLDESKKFEHFASYVTVRRNYSDTFDTSDIVTGAGGDTGIDGIAILINGSLINDIEDLEGMDISASWDVMFIFVQSETSSNFEAAKIGTFGFGIIDFFNENFKLPRNDHIAAKAETMNAIFKRSSKFKKGNPVCRLYYVTTGKWVGDANLTARLESVVVDLQNTELFREVKFFPVDAGGVQTLYRQAKNAVSREFTFLNRTVAPEMVGIKEAYLGFLPVSEFLKLVEDDNDEIIGSLFYDNVRDWLDEANPINAEIKATLDSAAKSRFLLMNNGITIIARELQPTGNKFLIGDYSIVNGCQTSHVLFNKRELIDDSVMIPVRLIGTTDETVINDIIRATNRQTPISEEQFFALQEFPKALEPFFQSFDESHKLYYERRTRQYDRLPVEKTRIILPANMIRAFAAMFLNEPHRTTRNYASLKNRVGTDIFATGHMMEPYYVAAFALYKLEYYFRTGRLEPKYKPAKFHILLAMRLLFDKEKLPPMNSREMTRFCKSFMEKLWKVDEVEPLIIEAAQVIEAVAAGDFHRDNIRTEPFTQGVIKELAPNLLQKSL